MNQAPPTSRPANGHPNGAPVLKRKKPTQNAFFKGSGIIKDKSKPPPPPPQTNGHLAPPSILSRPLTPTTQRSASPAVGPHNERVSGFTDPGVAADRVPYRDYKLVTTKRDLMDGLRYHILQLTSTGDKSIDIRSEADFPKPARLHRRDPRTVLTGPPKEEGEDPKDGFINQAERDEMSKRNAERQKEREANLSQIAPSQNQRKQNNFKKKIQQVFNRERTEEEKRRIQTNYEEKLPWHLEDFDNKHTFVGHNQIGSMNVYAAFAYESAGDSSTARFRLIPVEKYYKFEPKREAPKTAMNIEEIEAAMKRRGTEPEWLIRQREQRVADAAREMTSKKSKGLFSGAQDQTIAGRTGEDADLDFEDDFADDEEGNWFDEKDEDEKMAEKRIKEDQLTANFLDFKDVKEYDEAEEREKKEAAMKKEFSRGIKKALEKRERNYNHGSDSEETDETVSIPRLSLNIYANSEIDGL